MKHSEVIFNSLLGGIRHGHWVCCAIVGNRAIVGNQRVGLEKRLCEPASLQFGWFTNLIRDLDRPSRRAAVRFSQPGALVTPIDSNHQPNARNRRQLHVRRKRNPIPSAVKASIAGNSTFEEKETPYHLPLRLRLNHWWQLLKQVFLRLQSQSTIDYSCFTEDTIHYPL